MSPMASMTAEKTSWHCLPAEIRILILEALLQDGCNLAGFATVSREWQTIIEPHNFARIKLTPSRLAHFGPILHRNRALVRYIWLCLELPEYGPAESALRHTDMQGLSLRDNVLIATAFRNLFSTLSTWEPNGSLLLDISVHCPSDSEYWFKYLTFESDIPSEECHWGRREERSILVKADQYRSAWIESRYAGPTSSIIDRVFDKIMGSGPFAFEEKVKEWWQQLPLVPAITGVLLRQQTRRRWKPKALAQMFARLPRLQEIHYEPWREWRDDQQRETDQYFRSLFDSLASSQLRRLVLFENFNHLYPLYFIRCSPIRVPISDVSRAIAVVSLKLEHLSASFIVDAACFFNVLETSWEWPNLTSLALTSQLLAPDGSPDEIENMLKAAAAAAMRMPNLTIMEIWNGREGLAALFRYQPAGGGRPAVITWRGTWEFVLRPPVIQAWESVTKKYRGSGSVVIQELLDAGTIKSHGDAICHLKLLNQVIRPVSLRQIRMEHRIRKGARTFPNTLLRILLGDEV